MPEPSALPDPVHTGVEQAMNNMLEVVGNLLACHSDLLEIVEGMSEELATVSAQVAELKAAALVPPARQRVRTRLRSVEG